VDRLNERPNGDEGDATTRTPSTRSFRKTAFAFNAERPSLPPAIPAIIIIEDLARLQCPDSPRLAIQHL
jgi:hypothetical protein